MIEILRTTDPGKLSAAQALLADGGVQALIFDAAAGALWRGVIPQRQMIADEAADEAARLLRQAGFRRATDGDWDL